VYSDGSMPLKITLVWNDPPAPENTGSDRALRNNLDLKVTGPDGTIWYGNNGLYENLWSTSGTGVNHWSINNDYWDDLNNVENVFIQNPAVGTYTIEVFGRSGDMISSSQSFAIAAAGAQESVNHPPDKPTNPNPPDGATGIDLNPTLSVDVYDPDGDTMDITFYDASDDSIIGTDYDVPSGGTASVTWSGLDYDTTYGWYTIADDKKGGTNTSDTWHFTTKSAVVRFYATQDIEVTNGGITNDYTYTHDSDDQYEGIKERGIFGIYTDLEHKWTIEVTGGYTSYVFYLEAYHTANTEGDDFVFAYSTDDNTYTDMITVIKTTDDNTYQTFELPNDISGTIYIRVKDLDHTLWHGAQDTIYIDHMYIEAS